MKVHWRFNVVFAVVATLILILGDATFSLFSDSYDLQPKTKNLVAAFITFYLVSLLKQRMTKVVVFLLISTLMFIEMAHLSYYGTMFEPLEAWLFFIEMHEVMNVFLPSAHLFLPAAGISLVVFIMFYTLVIKTASCTKKHIVAGIFLLAIYTLPPIASTLKGSKFWKGATMDTFTFNASYRAFADFIVRVLPRKLEAKEALRTQRIEPVVKTSERVAKHSELPPINWTPKL